MRSGHRRTQSDNYYNAIQSNKLDLKIKCKENKTQIVKILKSSNTKQQKKTIYIQQIEAPQIRSHQNLIFCFGKKGHQTPIITTNIQCQDKLQSIPQKFGKKGYYPGVRKSLDCDQKNGIYCGRRKMVSPLQNTANKQNTLTKENNIKKIFQRKKSTNQISNKIDKQQTKFKRDKASMGKFSKNKLKKN